MVVVVVVCQDPTSIGDEDIDSGGGGGLSFGEIVHGDVLTGGFCLFGCVGIRLVEMYVICEKMGDALKVFDEMSVSVVARNMVCFSYWEGDEVALRFGVSVIDEMRLFLLVFVVSPSRAFLRKVSILTTIVTSKLAFVFSSLTRTCSACIWIILPFHAFLAFFVEVFISPFTIPFVVFETCMRSLLDHLPLLFKNTGALLLSYSNCASPLSLSVCACLFSFEISKSRLSLSLRPNTTAPFLCLDGLSTDKYGWINLLVSASVFELHASIPLIVFAKLGFRKIGELAKPPKIWVLYCYLEIDSMIDLVGVFILLQNQVTLSCSSVEAEYRGVANVVAETAWIRILLRELHAPLFTATLV
ncbi:hypothetical protein Tco_0795561 [Tanacetum coccineum]